MSSAKTDSAQRRTRVCVGPIRPAVHAAQHDTTLDPRFGFGLNPMDLDPSFSVFVNSNALFIDGKAPVHSVPQDLFNPFSFSSPTLSSASASPSGFTLAARPAHVLPHRPLSRSTAGASEDPVLE